MIQKLQEHVYVIVQHPGKGHGNGDGLTGKGNAVEEWEGNEDEALNGTCPQPLEIGEELTKVQSGPENMAKELRTCRELRDTVNSELFFTEQRGSFYDRSGPVAQCCLYDLHLNTAAALGVDFSSRYSSLPTTVTKYR